MAIAQQRTRRRQQREETRRQILDAAYVFLRERPFRELSVDALMSRTGHTRTVFYRHFDDIPSLVLAMITEMGAEMVDVAQEWADTDIVSAEEARRRLRFFVGFYVRNGPLVRAVAEAAHHDDAVEAAYNGMVEGFVAITAHAMQNRVDRGLLAPLDAPEIARALVRMLNGYLEDSLGHPGSQADPERVLETVATIWTRTMFPGEATG